jgi:hypothetical protein
VQFPKLPIIAVVAFACVSLKSFPVPSQTTTSSPPVLKGWKDRGETPLTPSGAATSSGMTKQQRLSQCLESWDAGTHMTKREWRRTCERPVRGYPGP